MVRILREAPGWQDALASALAAVPRPIPLDDRLLPRTPDGRPSRRQRDRATVAGARPAATLLAIYPDPDGQLVIPLTVRHGDLRAHAGEVSLPGGAVDATDASPEAAALREAWEEVGIPPSDVRVLGRLDQVWIPVSNFELQPFVGALATRPALVPHDAEVTAVVELPVAALWDPDVLATERLVVRGLTLSAGVYRYGGVVVWGATALTLGMLAHVMDTTD
jgi:8-oxo-dGTP pyrophosphatase MutT (NUDIX family)